MTTWRFTSSRRRASEERGQALVEFTVLLPVLLLLVFGIVEFGKAMNYWIDLTHMANEGSRYAAVNRWPGCPNADTGTCTPLKLSDYVKAQANTSELANGGTAYVQSPLAVTVCFPNGGSGVTTGSAGAPVRVTVSTKYKLPVVDGILGLVNLDSVGEIDMSAKSTMRLERTPTADRLLKDSPGACL